MLFRRETSHSNVGVDMYNRRRKNGNGRTANPDGELVVVQGDLSQEAAALLKTDFNLNLSADAMKKFGQYEDPQSPDEEHAPLSEEAFDIPEFVPASEEQVEEGAELRDRLKLEREKARRYQMLFEHTPEPLIFVSADLFIVKNANHSAARFFGIENGRLGGMPLLLFIDQDDRADFRAYVLSLLTENRTGKSFRFRLANKGECSASISGTAIGDGDRLIGLLLSIRPDADDPFDVAT